MPGFAFVSCNDVVVGLFCEGAGARFLKNTISAEIRGPVDVSGATSRTAV
jgi:hypothetical protein